MDHGSPYLTDHVINQVRSWGIKPASPSWSTRKMPRAETAEFNTTKKSVSQAVSQGAQAGRREACSQHAAATARRRATPDHGLRNRFFQKR
jgi:hypothetical protein